MSLSTFLVLSFLVSYFARTTARDATRVKIERSTRRERSLPSVLQSMLSNSRQNNSMCDDDIVPSWYRRDVTGGETAEWLNEALRKIWPSVVPQLDKLLCAAVNPQIEGNIPPVFTSLSFDSIRFGLTAPVVQSFSTTSLPSLLSRRRVARVARTSRGRDTRGAGKSVCVDCSFSFIASQKSDALIRLTVKTLLLAAPVLLDNVMLEGTVRVELRRVRDGELPCFDAVAFSFLSEPTVSFDLVPGSGLDVSHISLLRNFIATALRDQMSEMLVAPNVLEIGLEDLAPGYFG